MDAGPDALHTHEPLGAAPAGDADLGPISPELALIDPDLARRVRELLPEPRERPRPPRPARPAPIPAPEPEVGRRRRWPRTLALAVAIFVAGAVSGTFLGNHQSGSPATPLEVRVVAPATTRTTAARPVLRPPKTTHTRAAVSKPARRRRRPQVTWAANVLGVAATVSRRGVTLVWQRPVDSERVVVRRARGGRSSVVYRGPATSYRDGALRPCTVYSYTIVNYDRRGHRSTGVPTSVVTRCA